MLKSKRLFWIAGVVVVVLLLGWWAKQDADAKANDFVSANAKLQSSYKTEIEKLKLSSLIDVSDTGNEDAKKEQAVCSAADSLKRTLDDFNNGGIQSSVGSWLSAKYDKARATQKASENSRTKASTELASYSARCKYFARSTEASNAEKAIRKSEAYSGLLTYGTVTCKKSDGGCISKPNYVAFAKVYTKIIDVRKDYADFYLRTTCPFSAAEQQKLCEVTKRLTTAALDDSEQYVAALRQGNTNRINELARGGKANSVYEQLKALTKKLDPSAKSVDDYWRKLFMVQEKQLQQISL